MLVTSAAALAVVTGPNIAIDAWAVVGAGLWLLGFTIECIADKQKSQFRAHNKDGFISEGLWAWSRHPNYFGEIVLWMGIAVIAVPTLEGWRWAALISPVFAESLGEVLLGSQMERGNTT